MRISVIGMGYVGLSNATLLSTKYKVICYDIDHSKLTSIDNRISPIKDSLITNYFKNKKLQLTTTPVIDTNLSKTDFIIISTPTNYDPIKNRFDTTSIDNIIEKLNSLKSTSSIIIKSTIPVGFVKKIQKKYSNLKIYFSPEFLREGKALYDNLYPSRIIIGDEDKYSKKFINLFKACCLKKNIPIIFMSSTEAESVKLFSNSYLATRVAFFNELDSFSIENKMSSKLLIEGISADPRIGNEYNNPSFGFGGYCLPKDTKQLKANFKNIPNALISSLNRSNQLRKKYIAEDILKLKTKNIGIYTLAMKKGSDNFRESSIIDIIKILKRNGKNIFIYEPLIVDKKRIYGCEIINNFEQFSKKVNLIVTNRPSNKLDGVSVKVYTRDIYGES